MNLTAHKAAIHFAGVLNALFVVWAVEAGTAWALMCGAINFACILYLARTLLMVEEKLKQLKKHEKERVGEK